MRYLLDTHVLLWTLFDDDSLSETAKSVIIDPANSIYTSIITYWEISIKFAIGKIEFQGATPDILPAQANNIGIKTHNISEKLVAEFFKLPRIGHKDSFDRLIIWQAIHENIPLISKDSKMTEYQKYGLNILW